MLWIERKYLLLLSNKLRNFKEKGASIFNFSCPFCGDSQKNKIRARGYLYVKDAKFKYKCHNCGITCNFNFFLEKIDSILHNEYKLEVFKELGQKRRFVAKEPEIKETYNLEQSTKLLNSLGDLPANHPAVTYVESRQIPKKRWKDLYYVDNFKKYITNTYNLDPRRIERLVEDDPRLVMFLTDLQGNITHVNGRSIYPTNYQRYVKLKVVSQQIDRKVFGLSYVSFSKPLYVLEGEIDSMFLPNSVASGDSSLGHLANSLKLSQMDDIDVILVYDNEPRNKDIMRQLKESIEVGHKVVIWPIGWKGKDINEMVKDYGKSIQQIQDIIKLNTFKGLEAMLMFSDWSKS